MEQPSSHLTDFPKIYRENSSCINIWQEQRVLYMKTVIHVWPYLAKLFLEWEMFQTKVVGKIKTQILCSVTFSRKSCRLWDKVEKYFRVGRIHTHAGYLRLQAHTQNMQYLLLSHCKNGCTNASQCYVIGTLPVLLHVNPGVSQIN